MSKDRWAEEGFWAVLPNKDVNKNDKTEFADVKKRYVFVEPIVNPIYSNQPIDQDPEIYIRWGKEPRPGTENQSIDHKGHPCKHNTTYPIKDYQDKFPYFDKEKNKIVPRNRCQKCHLKYKNNGEDCCGMRLTGWIKIEGERTHTWSEINEYASCSLDDNDNDFGLYERIINAKNKNLKEKIRNYEKNKNW